MIRLGLLIGIIFPSFVSWIGTPSKFVLTPWFFAACITAGIIVGDLNITPAREDVGRRLHILADRLHRKVLQSSVATGEDVIKVTISAGGVSYPESDAASETEFVELADKALYQAKESGCDCVVMANAG